MILNEIDRIQVLDFGLACFRQGLLEPKNYSLDTDPVPDVSVLFGEPDISAASVFDLPAYHADPRTDDPVATLLQGRLVGTPAYMSPEQTYTPDVDLRSDIYSLGCSLFFLLSGKLMYDAQTIPEVLGSHRSGPMPSLSQVVADIPPNVDAVFQKMVAKRPEERFQSMAEVIAAMETLLVDLAEGPSVFLCYRRDDSFDATHRLYEQLSARFGEKAVIMDIDTIPPGEDFRAFLEKAVARCSVMLAIIGDHWVKIKDDKGKRRLDQRMDYVRFEIATALDMKKPVIPVLVGQASMPCPEDLPRELRDLAFLHAAELRSARDYRHHVDRLMERVQQLFRPMK